jgi:hypothetical protein
VVTARTKQRANCLRLVVSNPEPEPLSPAMQWMERNREAGRAAYREMQAEIALDAYRREMDEIRKEVM